MEKELIYREIEIGFRKVSDVISEYEEKGWRLKSSKSLTKLIFERECPLDFVRVYYLIDGSKRHGPFNSDVEAKEAVKVPGTYFIEKIYTRNIKNTSRIDRVASLIIGDDDEPDISCGITEFNFGIDYARNDQLSAGRTQIGRTARDLFFSSAEELRSQRVPPVVDRSYLFDIYNQISQADGSPHRAFPVTRNTNISIDRTALNEPALPLNNAQIEELTDQLREATWEDIMNWREPEE